MDISGDGAIHANPVLCKRGRRRLEEAGDGLPGWQLHTSANPEQVTCEECAYFLQHPEEKRLDELKEALEAGDHLGLTTKHLIGR
jgi:hypothetical protein